MVITETDSRETQINKLPRDQVERSLRFSGFLVFHCPLKPDAIEALQMLMDSSHRVSDRPSVIRVLCTVLTTSLSVS